MPTTAGSVALERSFPAADAPLVTDLRRAGAVILGKANLTEFANFLANGMPGGYSSLGGQVLNPYDVSQTPSGSSAGSGSAAAAGLATLTVGTETSGSILSPAVANSVVGIKPTVGLISRTGIVPIAASQDTAGPMTRTVADAAVELTALTGIDPLDPATATNPLADHDFTTSLDPNALRGARIGVVRNQIPAEGTDNRTLWDAATAELAAQGAVLVPVDLDTGSSIPGGSTVLNYEFKRDLNTYFARLPRNAPIRSLAEVIAYNEAHAPEALKFGQARAVTSQAMDLSPASTDTARYQRRPRPGPGRQQGPHRRRHARTTTSPHCCSRAAAARPSAPRAGYPSIAVPAGYQAANRRPFSITLLGQAWSEPTLIGYAYAYEQASLLGQPPSSDQPVPVPLRTTESTLLPAVSHRTAVGWLSGGPLYRCRSAQRLDPDVAELGSAASPWSCSRIEPVDGPSGMLPPVPPVISTSSCTFTPFQTTVTRAFAILVPGAVVAGGAERDVVGLPGLRRGGRVDVRRLLRVDGAGLVVVEGGVAVRVEDLDLVSLLQVDAAVAAVLPGHVRRQQRHLELDVQPVVAERLLGAQVAAATSIAPPRPPASSPRRPSVCCHSSGSPPSKRVIRSPGARTDDQVEVDVAGVAGVDPVLDRVDPPASGSATRSWWPSRPR